MSTKFSLFSKKTTYNKNDFLTLFCILLIFGVFNFLFFDKFATMTEGWFQDYANYIKAGQVMYRDFYMYIPPVFPWLMTLISIISDNSLIVFRIYGILERLVLVSFVFFIFKRVFSNKVIFISLLTASIIYISNPQDLFYGYYQTSLLFAVIFLYSFIKLIEKFDSKYYYCYAILAGVIAGITIATKHTTGVILALVLAIALIIIFWKTNKKRALKCGALGILGAFIVIGIVCMVLWLQSALIPCFHALFAGGSSKGNLLNVFFGFIPRIINPVSVILFLSIIIMVILTQNTKLFHVKINDEKIRKIVNGIYGLFLCGIAVFLGILLKRSVFNGVCFPTYTLHSIIFFFGCLLILCALYFAPRRWFFSHKTAISLIITSLVFCLFFIYIVRHQINYIDYMTVRAWRQNAIYASFFLLTLYIIYVLYQLLKMNKKEYRMLFLISISAWTIMFIHGMSYIIEDHGTLLSFTLLIGLALSEKTVFNFCKNLLIVVFCIGMIFPITVQRCYFPYDWWGVNTTPSIYTAVDHGFEDPMLKGLKSSEEVVKQTNDIYRLVQNLKEDGDTLYTFPHISYYNAMAKLPSDTYGKVHYFDVCPDDIAKSDAKILAKNPPDIIMWQIFYEYEWQIHEDFFRNGKTSGQRELEKEYLKITKNNQYEFCGEYVVGESAPIEIWHKIK
ncbi:MAG: glycosyltransferase family 39 protein [Clostridiales bacterium]